MAIKLPEASKRLHRMFIRTHEVDRIKVQIHRYISKKTNEHLQYLDLSITGPHDFGKCFLHLIDLTSKLHTTIKSDNIVSNNPPVLDHFAAYLEVIFPTFPSQS